MSKHWLIMVILLMFACPSVLPAAEMGGLVFEVYLQTRTVGRVLFNHALHGSECNMCHPKIFKQKSNSNHVNMKAMEKGRSCGACHNGKKAFSVTGNCVTCHAGDIIYENEDAGNITFAHSAHLENFGCEECHPELFRPIRGKNRATMADMESGKSCGACHNGSAAFSVTDDCEACHKM